MDSYLKFKKLFGHGLTRIKYIISFFSLLRKLETKKGMDSVFIKNLINDHALRTLIKMYS